LRAAGPLKSGHRGTGKIGQEQTLTCGRATLSCRIRASILARRVLTFMLSPVMQHVQESGTER